ncbi:CAP domain-containing protein [Actinokineospora sp. HUAS TT18]|uniref:CAP domain-containing protein n=1 Tax=Actinokineospora sp. HUAS TT18 TaxID=3447451 RepID=UPI003F523078
MTHRRGPNALVRAVLVALAVGAGTAGMAKILSGPPTIEGSPDRIALDVPTSVSSPAPDAPVTTKSAAGTVSGTSSAPTTASSSLSAAPTTTTTPPTTVTTTTTKKPKPTTTPPTDTSAAGQVLALVNNYRSQHGCGAVTLDSRLNNAAQDHSDDMSYYGYFSHTSLDGRSFVDRAHDAGYPSPGAENIARGQTSAAQVMTAWMNSSGHRANILNCSMRTMGLGLATRGYYWTQMFGY